MGVSKKQLLDEKTTLKKTFDEIQSKLQVMQKEQEQYKNNLNAVGGALQQVEKLLSIRPAESGNLNKEGIDIDTGKKVRN